MVNVLELEPGAQIRLVDQRTAEVVSNPRDGVWVLIRYLSVPDNPAQTGTEELVFAENVLERL